MAVVLGRKGGGGAGGGGAPSGPAGGVLGGTYPNPSFAADMATQAELDAVSTVASAALPKLLTPAPSADVTVSGITATMTVGENVVFGDPLYMKSDGKLWKADANQATTFPVFALASATIAADAAGLVLLWGFARNDAWAWTVGGQVYLSTSAGLTQTQPSATDDVIQVLGVATHADRLLFRPSSDYMTHT